MRQTSDSFAEIGIVLPLFVPRFLNTRVHNAYMDALNGGILRASV